MGLNERRHTDGQWGRIESTNAVDVTEGLVSADCFLLGVERRRDEPQRARAQS